ncbi:NACHT domain-containing protein [Anabaena sp. WFMT]|uniref:NACHT domain-containing protein n=1 Tax=Anabaena sp. WFMT TaxID=3449730 RepID=UPI003F295453
MGMGMGQNQDIGNSSLANSEVQQTQAGRDAVSFQNSKDNQVTINNTILRLFGKSEPQKVDWDWGKLLLEKKQLPDIRQRLTDTLGQKRISINVSFAEQLSWVNRTLQINGQDYGNLDANKLLIETYGRDDIAGKLLILGAPGAGKTTALLSLAEQLICGALKNPQTVIPVLFELSTWRDDNQSIEQWLIEQLYELHGGNRKYKIYERWLEQQVLLPLLDGLDELGLERQKKCTIKLQEFAQNYPHVVVCCRLKEFEAVNLKLKTLRGAVCLQPLSDIQIQNYLHSLNRSELWSVIKKNVDFRKLLEPTPEGEPGLLRVPLFVKLVVDVYDPQKPISSKADLLEKYIDRQLSIDTREQDRRKEKELSKWAYKTVEDEVGKRQTSGSLTWIAQVLKENHQTEFLIEKMQPKYLNKKLRQWQYWLLLFMVNILISGTIATVMILPLVISEYPFSWSFIPNSVLVFGLFFGFIISTEPKADGTLLIIYPLVYFFCFLFKKEIPIELKKYVPILHNIDLSYRFRLRIPSLKDLKMQVFQPSLTLALVLPKLMAILPFNIMSILLMILYDILELSRYPDDNFIFLPTIQKIKILDQEGFCWLKIFITITFFPITIIFIILFGTISLISILFSEKIETSYTPNQGLEEAFKSVFFISILLLFYIFYFSFLSFQIQPIYYQIINTVLGFLACSIYLPVIKHLCLRFILWQSGTIPWNLAQFLNYCVERRLLLRVGGRYRFLHRELLDHFAQSSNP